MATIDLLFRQKSVLLHKAHRDPNVGAPSILVSDPWAYVEMFLRRQGSTRQLAFWRQSQAFFRAADAMPNEAAPLPLYYSMLNAVKALLLYRNVAFADEHGVAGAPPPGRVSLAGERATLYPSGVLAGLWRVLGGHPAQQQLTLSQLLHNLVFIHRAYTLTYSTAAEVFVPIVDPRYRRRSGSAEAWLEFSLRNREDLAGVLRRCTDVERATADPKSLALRLRQRFEWARRGAPPAAVQRLRNYHNARRGLFRCIHGAGRLWYLVVPTRNTLTIPEPVLTFAAMHRLSELSRYQPDVMSKHLSAQHNWILSEFIERAGNQFITQIASEITGSDFLPAGIDSRKR